eukprot:462569-Rhodomonas_salina.2
MNCPIQLLRLCYGAEFGYTGTRCSRILVLRPGVAMPSVETIKLEHDVSSSHVLVCRVIMSRYHRNRPVRAVPSGTERGYQVEAEKRDRAEGLELGTPQDR